MKIKSTNVFLGPSIYAHFPVIRLLLDLGVLEQWPTGKLGESYVNALLEALPGLQGHGCSYGVPGGFVRRLREDEGTWLGHVMEHVAIELQNVAGIEVSFGRTRSTGTPAEYTVVYQYQQREVGLEAGELARNLLVHLLPAALQQQVSVDIDEGFDFAAQRDAFVRFAQRREFGPSTASLVQAAEARGIPWLRLNPYSLVQFGHGSLQKRIQATITSETRHIAVEIACDKEDTHNLLSDLGLPVPVQRLVYNAEQAARAARRIGFPVVVKPLDANHGRGVSINLGSEAAVRSAFDKAREQGKSRSIIVESYASGFDHRMLVVNGELIAVAKRVPGHVVGDGVHPVSELIETVNADPRRGIGHQKVLTRLEIDDQARRLLKEKNYTPETVIAKGETLFLRATANLSTGGTAIDLTDQVHPDNRIMAIQAVQAVGLDVGGVDFLSEDIAQSYKDIGGAIVEINAAPGFRMHVAPSEGQPRDVAGPVIDMLFPPGTPSRIPIAALTGTNGKTTTARMLAHILKTAGHHVGLTSSDGVYIDGHLSVKGDMTGPRAAHIVLRDPTVDMAVMETARGGLLRNGMGYRHCDVGAVLNVTADHLGMRGIDTLEQLAEVKRIIVEVASKMAVLNADDTLCLKMADYTHAEKLCYVTLNPRHSLVREHIRSGGTALVLEAGINGDMITLYAGGAHMPLLWTHLIPATLEGRAIHNVQNAMFAAAMAYALGKGLKDIEHGLRTFTTSFFQAPGRMNVFDEHPFRVILDYAHNPDAVEKMCRVTDKLEVAGKRICLLAAPGDRRDEEITGIARAAAGHFDHYIVKADDDRRGRGADEVPRLLRKVLITTGMEDKRIEVIADEQQAVAHGLQLAQPGDLLLIFADAITRTWKQIIHFKPDQGLPDAQSCPTPRSMVENPPEEPFVANDAVQLIRDQRGVRIARDADDGD